MIILIIAAWPEDCHFVNTNKGFALVDNDGHKYFRDSISGPRFGWKCSKYIRLHCKARVTSIDNIIIKRSKKQHNHAPGSEELENNAASTTADPLQTTKPE
jgi:hypothetical protein